jgi:hypothetical protein
MIDKVDEAIQEQEKLPLISTYRRCSPPVRPLERSLDRVVMNNCTAQVFRDLGVL